MKKQTVYVPNELTDSTKLLMSKQEFTRSYGRTFESYFEEFDMSNQKQPKTE
jgi:hypothetical protein